MNLHPDPPTYAKLMRELADRFEQYAADGELSVEFAEERVPAYKDPPRDISRREVTVGHTVTVSIKVRATGQHGTELMESFSRLMQRG